ncbi:leucine-rich repeat domain-containing protein [Marinigracilibium pacificum]|uniref:Leucine-rich repeat domain-containing protein n=1 Tax=Marinigracilibium pacificum TaxID=2729599 RepID=A0A848IY21_9BACT|nr:leucine-rich repeat domain-containing protein [Marinigracilibium pacificum]NMM48185.1 leucine-rich repeat domain-containing protein [Marinigracilibium pacificum]
MNSRNSIIVYLLIFTLAFTSGSVYAQGNMSVKQQNENKQRVEGLVSFLEYLFNTLGGDRATVREKQIITDQSYLKVFKDAEVQIEDDLDEERSSAINKDVQDYLKDIDFFFQKVNFELQIKNISLINSKKGLYTYKVTLVRRMNGTNVKGEKVSSDKIRYIEVNLDEAKDDLKVVSMYSTDISESEINQWWSKIPDEWKIVFLDEVGSDAKLDFSLLKRIANIDKIDISNNKNIKSLKPLETLINLKEINMAHTEITSLKGIQDLKFIEVIDISDTDIADIDELTGMENLRLMFVQNSLVSDLTPLSASKNLQKIYCDNTPISPKAAETFQKSVPNCKVIFDRVNLAEWWGNLSIEWKKMFSRIIGKTKMERNDLLKILNLQAINISDDKTITTLDPIKDFKDLKEIKASNTGINSIQALADMQNLEVLDISYTQVSDLSPIANHKNISKLNFEKTRISSLDVIKGYKKITYLNCEETDIPEKEIEEYISNNPKIQVIYKAIPFTIWWINLSPAWQSAFKDALKMNANDVLTVEQLHDLVFIKQLDLSNNPKLESLEPLTIFKNLRKLNVSNSRISSLDPIKSLNTLEWVDASKNPISTIETLESLQNLRYFNIEFTQVEDASVVANWQELKELKISATYIRSLKPVGRIVHLEKVEFYNTDVKDIGPVLGLNYLKKLVCYNTKISKKDIDTFRNLNEGCEVVYY